MIGGNGLSKTRHCTTRYIEPAIEAYERGNLAKAEFLLEKAAFFGCSEAVILLSRLYLEEGFKEGALRLLEAHKSFPDVLVFLNLLKSLDVDGELLAVDFRSKVKSKIWGNILESSRLIFSKGRVVAAILPKDPILRNYFIEDIATIDKRLLNLFGED